MRKAEFELLAAVRGASRREGIAQGNYSVFDVLTGRAMIDSLNIIDPENSYSLVGDDDEFDDDEFDEDEIYD